MAQTFDQIQGQGLVVHGGAVHSRHGGFQAQALRGFPAVEGIGVVRQHGEQLGIGVVVDQVHRGTEAAQQGRHGLLRHVLKHQGVLIFMQYQQLLVAQGFTAGAEQTELDRDDESKLDQLAGGGFAALLEMQTEALRICVVAGRHRHLGCARLGIPAFELRQVLGQRRCGIGVGDGLGEIIASHGLTIVALKVQLHAFGKPIAAHQGLHHAHHFRAFFVDGDGVEVVDFQIAVGAHRMRQRTRVFGKLHGAQQAHIFNAFDRPRGGRTGQVLAEFLVAEHREAFFQRQLKPIAASDAVAGPVVEILVADDAFDVAVVGVGGGGRAGQHVLGVENIQALVFHRAHVEVRGGHHHEALQVQAQAKAGFVPGHTGHE